MAWTWTWFLKKKTDAIKQLLLEEMKHNLTAAKTLQVSVKEFNDFLAHGGYKDIQLAVEKRSGGRHVIRAQARTNSGEVTQRFPTLPTHDQRYREYLLDTVIIGGALYDKSREPYEKLNSLESIKGGVIDIIQFEDPFGGPDLLELLAYGIQETGAIVKLMENAIATW